MTVTFRSILLLMFALFWGGLTFYTGFAVRIAHAVLSDPMEGGLTTQRVTVILQWLGVATAVLMFCNGVFVAITQRGPGGVLILLTLILALALVGLFVVHDQLDAVISIEHAEVTDEDRFDAGHRRYNQLTTVEWIASVLYVPVTLLAWRRQDAASLAASTD